MPLSFDLSQPEEFQYDKDPAKTIADKWLYGNERHISSYDRSR